MKKTAIFILSILVSWGCNKVVYKTATERRAVKQGTLMQMNSEEFLIENNIWNLQSSDHIKFYFDKSISDSLKEQVIEHQVNNYHQLVTKMGIEKTRYPKVVYFLFKDKYQKQLFTQVDSDAHAIAPIVYHLPKNATGGQEIGHVITQTVWGFIPNDSEFALLIDEGFNYYIDNDVFYKGKLDQHAANYFETNPLFEVQELTLNGKGIRSNGGGHSQEESFVAGSFVKFLIETYGIDKFSELWMSAVKEKEPDFFKIYGKNLSQLGIEYKESLG